MMFYSELMERIPVRELNQNTSAVLARVERGETLEVTVSGRPVARLVPIEGGHSVLDRLVAQGRAIAPQTAGPVPMPPVLGDPTINVAEDLAAAREEERW
ncbi:MAG TPA: type II toxin-antitoxin system prevent-host-death family antitoxin [Streptosporangiaceae bacterium]